MKLIVTFALILLLLPTLALTKNPERNFLSAKKFATQNLERSADGKWKVSKDYLDSRSSFTKSKHVTYNKITKDGNTISANQNAAMSNFRRSVDSKVLTHGNLLVTEIWQQWVNSSWTDSEKYSYKYDVKNNNTEFLFQYWDNGIWNDVWIELYAYDGENMVSDTWQDWDPNSSVWVNTDRWIYEYDGAGNLSSFVYQPWNGAEWINVYKELISYDDNNNVTESISQGWSGTAWTNDSRIVQIYDQNNNISESTGQGWDPNNGWVINSYKNIFIYDESANLLEEYFQNYENNEWVNTARLVYIYSDNNAHVEFTHQEFSGVDWLNITKTVILYDANKNEIENSIFLWNSDNSIWENYFKVLNKYNVHNDQIEYVEQIGSGLTWINDWKEIYPFDDNFHQTGVILQYWQNNAWQNYWNANFSYMEATGIDQDLHTVYEWRLADNYPNPFNPSTTISYQLALDSQVDLSIYNLLGQRVSTLVSQKQPAGTYNVEWNASDLPSGVYFYQLQTGSGFVQSKKLVLLK